MHKKFYISLFVSLSLVLCLAQTSYAYNIGKVPNTNKLPLVETALGGDALPGQMYVVPAIFLKYNHDKIRNDYIEKGIVTTLDVATIALSGGTALATKVHWVRRAWALAEVAGAVGNIAVNTQAISSPKVKEAVDIYNAAMGLIGLNNIGQGGYKFIKNLPKHTKKLLEENGNLRQAFKEHYVGFKSKLSHSKALGEYDDLEASTKNTLNKQEQVLDEFVKGVDVGKRTFTQQEIDEYVAKATHTNPKGKKQVMLGKYDYGAETSYIRRAGDNYTYFDLGENGWKEAFNIVQSDDEMWKINKEFLRQQKEMGCDFYFSHDPYDSKIRTGFTRREIEYLTNSVEKGGLGGHINPEPVDVNLWKVEFQSTESW